MSDAEAVQVGFQLEGAVGKPPHPVIARIDCRREDELVGLGLRVRQCQLEHLGRNLAAVDGELRLERGNPHATEIGHHESGLMDHRGD